MTNELLVLDRDLLKRLIRRRRAIGADRRDEIWDGVYVIMPLADNEHQELIGRLTRAIDEAVGSDETISVYPGVNVSDQPAKWKQNFRCPDVAVFCPGNPAEDRQTHYYGGPDFAVEVISPNDRSRKKFDFYAAVHVHELLLVARKPWRLELYRRHESEWTLVGKSDVTDTKVLASAVLPLTFRLIDGEHRPRIEVARSNGSGTWLA
jgi:Uma2 family endonuclease